MMASRLAYFPPSAGSKALGLWHMEAPPNVIIKAKQVFPKAKKGLKGLVISDTPENCRDLKWFMSRYPCEIESATWFDAQVKRHEDNERLIQGILCGESRVAPKVAMALPPRQYQQIAADLVSTTGHLLLADDVGLGKTVSAIAAIAARGAFPVLIVTLTHLPRQWQRELDRFLPGIRSHILKKGSPYPVDADVYLTNYHKLVGWGDWMAENVKAVVFDEIQDLRHEDTNKYDAAKMVARGCEMVLGLSATPIYNYGGEMINVMHIIKPECLGSREEFFREWCHGDYGEKAKISNPQAFGHHLTQTGLMLRRTRTDVGRELPGLSVIPYAVDTDKRILDSIDGIAVELAKAIVSKTESVRGERFQASGQFDTAMRQITGIAKASFVADFVQMLIDNGEKVVLFGWHHAVYEIWLAKLREHRPALYTGRETPREKEEAVRRFTSGETPVIILSIRSGAGLDGLQHHCRTVVFGEIDWSPAAHEQAIGRVYRDGQAEPVCAYFLLSDDGSDPIVADVVGVKRAQIEGIRDPDAPLVTAGADPDHIRKLAEAYLSKKGKLGEERERKVVPIKQQPEELPPNCEQLELFGGRA